MFSAAESAFSRPSGRPTASSAPRTTRWVCLWTRWSLGLALATESELMEYERAKSLETNASSDWATQGMSPISSERPATRWSQWRPWHSRRSTVVHHGKKADNPVDSVWFFSKDRQGEHKGEQQEARLIEEDEQSDKYAANLPRAFIQRRLRVFCKKSEKRELVKEAWGKWRKENLGDGDRLFMTQD